MITIDLSAWPQFVVVGWWAFALLVLAHEHGKPRTGKTSFWFGLGFIAVSSFVLYMGSFFSA